MSTLYKHTQIGYFLIAVYSIVMLFAGVLFHATDHDGIAISVLAVMLVVLAQFCALTVSVDDQSLHIRFGLGIVRKRFRLGDIATYRAVRNPWYYGWGIRYTSSGWLFSVSGLSAVELTMKSGRVFRIGTDHAGSMVQALDGAMSEAESTSHSS